MASVITRSVVFELYVVGCVDRDPPAVMSPSVVTRSPVDVMMILYLPVPAQSLLLYST